MSSDSTTIAIFGDADLGLWGLLVDGTAPSLALGPLRCEPGQTRLESATVDHDDGQIWTVTAGDRTLRIERAEPTTTSGGELPLEPVRVTGTIALGGTEQEIDLGGALTEARLEGGIESLRVVGSWFPAGRQVALRCARPRDSKGHDRDQIGVIATGERLPIAFDARLSTTYDGAGTPLEAGIEMWIGADEEGEQYPRRVTGVATGAGVQSEDQRLSVAAYALDCLSHGEMGAGVYVLVRPA